MKISSFTEEELVYFTNFLKQLSLTMKEASSTNKKLNSLARKFHPPRSFVNLKEEEIVAVKGILSTAFNSLSDAIGKTDPKEQIEHLEKIMQILVSIEGKLR